MFQRILAPYMLSIFLCKSTETDIKNACVYVGLPWWQSGKESSSADCQCGRQLRSLGWEDPLRRKWQPTPAFLPGKSHGQKSMVGTVQCYKESHTIEVT